ncbi:hypothetical protein DL768_008902 [Monosporascus sp. mg162]|nr:hypothetical protein DL768_008902 [Monosporascus sp. mg162]
MTAASPAPARKDATQVSAANTMFVESFDGLFRPLKEGHIRLIQLLPGTRTAPLSCRLDTVALKDRPHFNALSYVWGTTGKTETLALDGVDIPITRNLHVALQYLRHGTEPTTLWVDALCICQGDNVEKGQQVRMMGDIFRGARLTWIWLGEASQEDDAVMDYLSTNARQSDSEGLAELPIRSLQSFFGRPWFRRLWILQEALLSQQPIVKCGDKQTAFERVIRLSTDLIFKNLGNRRGDPFVNCPLQRCLQEWDRLKHIVLERGGWSLVYAMPMAEQLECTLFEDRVFALLGLSTELDRKTIKPDYTKPFAQIQARICAHLISSPENPLAALHYMGVRGNSELPSWARDWSKPKRVEWHFWRQPAGAQERWHFLSEMRAGIGHGWLDVNAGKQAWQMEVETGTNIAHFSDDLRILALKGISVDTIKSVHGASAFDKNTVSWKRECESWRTLAIENATAYPNREARFDAFCNTLCSGRYRDARGKPSTNWGEAYESWIRGEDESDSSESNGGVGRTPNDFAFRTERFRAGRSFIITRKGFMGLAPENARTGDMVCFFKGNLDPFILRSKSGIHQEFIGETLIAGLMEGEWVGDADVRDITEYWIE